MNERIEWMVSLITCTECIIPSCCCCCCSVFVFQIGNDPIQMQLIRVHYFIALRERERYGKKMSWEKRHASSHNWKIRRTLSWIVMHNRLEWNKSKCRNVIKTIAFCRLLNSEIYLLDLVSWLFRFCTLFFVHFAYISYGSAHTCVQFATKCLFDMFAQNNSPIFVYLRETIFHSYYDYYFVYVNAVCYIETHFRQPI